jgi:hypothetical protein
MIASHYRFEHCQPIFVTMDVALPQQNFLHIAKLVEAEQRVVAGASKMPVIGTTIECK